MEWGLLSTELWWFLYPLHEYKISFEAHEVSCVQVSFINLLHKFLFAFLFVAPKQILWCQLENLSALNSWKVMIFWAYFYTCQTIFESKVWTFFFVWPDHLLGCLEVSENSMKESKDTLEEFPVQSCLLHS